ncbi:Asp-tRNA(Asn)/Glu-tRNA(Gln) amidotransferase subunit GatA [candidate division KSB1 bacterium]
MKSIKDVVQSVRSGEKTCEFITNKILTNIQNKDNYNIFLDLFIESSLKQARKVDANIYKEKAGSLAGYFFGIKDNICIAGKRTTCGSKILENYISPYSATVISKIIAADGIIIGKTNMDEFAMGSSTENSFFGPVLNPVNIECVPGGSSGGSAASVAAGLTNISLGSDTGGSIRQPAAFCGVVGMKPTYGRVSRFGLVAFASSLDQIGPLGNKVEDVASVLQIIAGYDKKDSTSADIPVPDYLSLLKNDKDTKNLRIGVPVDYLGEGLDKKILKNIDDIIEKLKKEGFQVGKVNLPHTPYSVAAYYIIANAEASSNLARYDGARYGFRNENPEDLSDMYMDSRSVGFGEEVKRRIILGTFVLSSGYYDEYYAKAQKVRRLILDDFNKAFNKYDVLLTPTAPTLPYRLGEKLDNPLEMYLGDIYTVPVNLAGLPALVIPTGRTDNGLPIGLQLIGRHFEEQTLFKIGSLLEKVRDQF